MGLDTIDNTSQQSQDSAMQAQCSTILDRRVLACEFIGVVEALMRRVANINAAYYSLENASI
jgi:hypothetical protein